MEIVKRISDLREKLKIRRKKDADLSVGFVPTMGYLHEGHLSLIHEARQNNDIVVISIFVNPLQFGANEDLESYPRNTERDLKLAEEAGADIVFLPEVVEMYPSTRPILTKVTLSGVTEVLCGKSRPVHFDGVATVVIKLFHIVQPDQVYFGMKDAQQVAVIQQMVDDLNIPVKIVPCPTLREQDGLAKSSRNFYLSQEERSQATVLYEALQAAVEMVERGENDPTELKQRTIALIGSAPLAKIDYVELLKYPSMASIEDGVQIQLNQKIIIAVAVFFGKTRLIDNVIIGS